MNNISMKVENIDDIVLTLTATAKLKEWRKIKSSLISDEPLDAADCFKGVLSDLISRADIELN